MRAFALASPVVLLNQPAASDTDRILEYCQDPIFERYLTVPWPYDRKHAEGFLDEFVPDGWMTDREYTWAVREPGGSELLGVIGLRLAGESATAKASVHRVGSIGFWLGAPHRGRGLIPEAQRLVADWAFSTGTIDVLHWECLLGNVASARAAWKSGFRYAGVSQSVAAYRDGSYPESWQGHLAAGDDRNPQPCWPAAALAR
ncbi:MAG: GNAT family N-acetyltransferase [Cryobacterium sp.]|uniref:GNAT family N-acetyltransferase n=1 Tax=unclassified Cryobacterium TaxID=2649013 RepID=UPI0018CA4B31|nr:MULTISPECIES: GNAT family N-acetyltransferase [unclassified Cryobacterium]MCY7404806.1 GNAT family N-acetyltransferase [Cryobacterium sp.]MEC5153587.1 RimJ/RimL family protein N-acetyltransferase [Cryobacterium sp. CAN_C3]